MNLAFFRKYQKGIFLVVAIFTIISIVFFGTYQSFAPSSHGNVKDEVLFQTYNGQNIKTSLFNPLYEFISYEPALSKTNAPNFLNDGVITKDFISSGAAFALFRQESESIISELDEKHDREHAFKPYVHPRAPQLSAETIWSLFAPEVKENFEKFSACTVNNAEKFEAKCQLFLSERHFPGALLAQILRYQEQQTQNLLSDPKLYKEELSLFGYRSVEDWFGKEFTTLAAKFILNCAQLARAQGYKVTHEEVKSQLLSHCEKFSAAIKAEHLPAQTVLNNYLRMHQLTEEQLISVYREICLFRKVMEDAASAPLIDGNCFQSYYGKAKEYATVEILQLPEELRFKDKQQLIAFERYLKKVAHAKIGTWDLPTFFDPVEEIEKRAPELLGKKIDLQYAVVEKKSLQSIVSLKETLEWEENHWNELAQQFPFLKTNSEIQPLDKLEALSKKERVQVDSYARAQIVNLHPEWIDAALQESYKKEKSIFLSKKGTFTFEGIKNSEALAKKLIAGGKIDKYSEDENRYFSFLVKAEGSDGELLSFPAAVAEGVLNQPMENEENHLCSLIDMAKTQGLIKKELSKDQALDQIAKIRFKTLLEKQLLTVSQWQPIKKIETISYQSEKLPFKTVINAQLGQFSPMTVTEEDGAIVWKLIDKKSDTTLPLEKLLKMQEVLSTASKQYYAETLFNKFKQAKA